MRKLLFIAAALSIFASCKKESSAPSREMDAIKRQKISVDPTNTNNPYDFAGQRVQEWIGVCLGDNTLDASSIQSLATGVLADVNADQQSNNRNEVSATVDNIMDFETPISNKDWPAAVAAAYNNSYISSGVKSIMDNYFLATEQYRQGKPTADAGAYNSAAISFENNLVDNTTVSDDDKAVALQIVSGMKYANAYSYNNNVDLGGEPGFIIIIIIVIILICASATPAY